MMWAWVILILGSFGELALGAYWIRLTLRSGLAAEGES